MNLNTPRSAWYLTSLISIWKDPRSTIRNVVQTVPLSTLIITYVVFWAIFMGLYFIMGLAFWSVLESHYRNPGHRICFAVGLFILQFAATLMWGWAFFGHLSIPGGLLCSTIICALVFLTMIKFFKHSPFAGGLMLVYFMWTLLDCYLIFKVAELNP